MSSRGMQRFFVRGLPEVPKFSDTFSNIFLRKRTFSTRYLIKSFCKAFTYLVDEAVINYFKTFLNDGMILIVRVSRVAQVVSKQAFEGQSHGPKGFNLGICHSGSLCLFLQLLSVEL